MVRHVRSTRRLDDDFAVIALNPFQGFAADELLIDVYVEGLGDVTSLSAESL